MNIEIFHVKWNLIRERREATVRRHAVCNIFLPQAEHIDSTLDGDVARERIMDSKTADTDESGA
jgi:hypothetical protein